MMKTELIARSFHQAAATYDAECYQANKRVSAPASLQAQSADILLARLKQQRTGKKANNLLDLGCGTGVHQEQLKAFSHTYLGVDLAYGMVRLAYDKNRQQKAKKKNENLYLQADAHALPFASASLDLIFSNLALQWCGHQQRVAEELYRVCKTHAEVHFSTLVAGSLPEFQQLQQLGLLTKVNQYPLPITWVKHLQTAGFQQINWQLVPIQCFYPSPAALLASIKNIGASVQQQEPQQKKQQLAGLKTPSWLKQVYQALERYRQEQGVPLSYSVVFISALK